MFRYITTLWFSMSMSSGLKVTPGSRKVSGISYSAESWRCEDSHVMAAEPDAAAGQPIQGVNII